MRAAWIFLAAVAVFTTGCAVDPGPTLTAADKIETGKADSVRAEIRMNAGELRVEGGASSLLDANFRYSERAGRPAVHYSIVGAHGLLTVESPHEGPTMAKMTNDWTLRLASEVPLDLSVRLGAGESHLNVSRLALRSAEVDMGAGEMTLNMAGRYSRDVNVRINGGVGEAHIRLPRETGAVVEATGGIGDIEAHDLTQRGDGRYYNAAYAEEKPAVHMTVRGGVGNIVLNVGE
jgi:hypothetical protein